MVLVDSGSIHNFVNERVTNLLRLSVVLTDHFLVKVVNGRPMKYSGHFEDVSVDLQGISFYLTLYVLPLISLDLMLKV